MIHGQSMQQPFARGRQPDIHLAPVLFRHASRRRSAFAQPVDQLDRAVVPDLQARSQLADGGSHLRRQSLDREQQLVLLRLQAVRARRFLAISQEPADLMTEFRQRAKPGW